MDLNFICPILAIVILMSPVSTHILTQKSLASILDEIFSPSNTERALQMINTAGTRANKNVPEIVRYPSADYGLPVPARVITSDYGRNGILPVGIEPRYITDSGRYYENLCSGQKLKQATFIDSLNFPKEIYKLPIQESVPNTCQPNIYYPTTEPYIATQTPYLPGLNQYLPGLNPSLPGPNPYLPVSNQYLPVSNPYLPAASPVSMSTYMPPPTQSKGQFLRKIPIPPPTL